MKLKNLFFVALALIIAGLIYYRITKNAETSDKGKDKGDKKQTINVSGIVLKSQVFNDDLSLSGSIDANEQVEIHSETSGIVESINFQEGTNVTKGQLLFKVNDVELRAQLNQAKTKENLAFENERRAKLLLQKEAISQEEYDIASADYRSAKAQSQLISAQIGKTSVKAPFSGKIGLRNISPGTYITPTVLVANLVNTSQLKITFSIPEKYATQVKMNSALNFTVAGSSEKYSAKIYAIEPGIEVNTRTMQIRAVTQNSNGKLLPGTFADIVLPLTQINDAIIVPSEAIVPVQSGKKVYIANNGIAKEVKVETSSRTDSSVLVLSGLKVGDTLITSGVMSLKDEAPIKLKMSRN
ncbi:efflux RND transporter periplasmic adaptor subunit [Flavobacterium sp. SUN052]|uniref:efflux RND transporter periplasmic adaptor subunit n=1 Tax=Flavobacterium sp. SUN052 TaxID=3002441 RepID=UPI00237D8406|nr:efflux RND transporter periplasmic adaptor subunit [Flavobacterium sp. SUN052]MEC4005798.1 efflux RND transporter periplasmic adaptor subunit [Flavobacterium sp. SUN052]